jgi:glycosyltransferase involved in cell wall biosynthesis
MMNTKPADGEKSILFVAYHFPPDSQIGGKRVARLSKYLIEKGWKVGVLTVKERYYEKRDDSFVVEGVDIFRTATFVNVRFLYMKIKKWLRRSSQVQFSDRLDLNAGITEEHEVSLGNAGDTTKEGLIARIRRNVLSMVKLPDDYLGWVLFGLFRLLPLIGKYDIIYTSAPPRSALLIPLLATRFSKKFLWVSEFRDPWTYTPKPAYCRSKFTDYLEKRWEYKVIEKSTMVFVVTEAMEEDFAKRYPEFSNKLRTFYNGFDKDEFSHINSGGGRRDTGKLTMAYAGQFDYGRDPRILMEAVSSLIDENELRRDEIEIRLMGDQHFGGMAIRDMITELKLGDVVREMGYVPYRNCLEQMSESDILILFNIRQPLQVPAKFYEYLALGKRILSISTGGITDRLIEKTGTGISVRPDDIAGIKRAIMELASVSSKVSNEEEVNRFNVRSIFEELEAELHNLSGMK